MNIHPDSVLPVVLESASRAGLFLFSAGLCGIVAVWAGARLAGGLAPAPWHAAPWSAPHPDAAARRVAAAHWFGEARPPVPPALQLTGVFAPARADAYGFAAVEDGEGRRPLRVGDAIGGWRVTRIAADGVELEYGRFRHFQPLAARLPGPSSFAGDVAPFPDPAEGGF